MKALVKSRAEPGLWLEDVPQPTIGPNDVLIKVDRTGICGTDMHIYNWDAWARKTVPAPMIIGHEFVGEIVAVGASVSDFRPGAIVSGEGHVVCGRCRNCLAGRRHLCNVTSGVGVNRPGAFAEYVSLPVTNVWIHDDSVDRDVAAVFDALGNAVHTVLAFPVLGRNVVITGAGPIGLLAVAVARHARAHSVVITDVIPYRLELAKRMGANIAIDVRAQSLREAREQLGIEKGFDVGLEMSGDPGALQDIVPNLSSGGSLAILGIPNREVPIDWPLVISNGLTIKGIYGREMFETWYKMTVMLQSGLDIRPVITHRYPYTEFQAGFETIATGKSGKVILHWSPEH
jgi:threonine 3-dehydrogenase